MPPMQKVCQTPSHSAARVFWIFWHTSTLLQNNNFDVTSQDDLLMVVFMAYYNVSPWGQIAQHNFAKGKPCETC